MLFARVTSPTPKLYRKGQEEVEKSGTFHLFIHSFIQSVYTEHLAWPGTAVGAGETGEDKIEKAPVFMN